MEVAIEADGRALRLTVEAARTVMLTADQLRRACRCASCRAAERLGVLRELSTTSIVECNEVGAYAVQLRFSDGHDRGVYPLVYLRALAAG